MPFNSRAEALRSSSGDSSSSFSSRRRCAADHPRRSQHNNARHHDSHHNRNRHHRHEARPARQPIPTNVASPLCIKMREICTEFSDCDISPQTQEKIHAAMASWINHKSWTREEADLAVSVLRKQELTSDDKPKLHDFTSVINAFAKVPACCEAADNILSYMEETGRPEIRPDRVTINTVIGALAKSGERGSAQRAEMLLRKLEKDYASGDKTRRPNTKSYGKVIDAYARANEFHRAIGILKRLEKQFYDGNNDIELTVHMYTSIIDGFAKSGRRDAPEQAESVLQSLLKVFDRYGTIELRPDAILFSAVINAWSKSSQPERSTRALAILKDMRARNVEIDLQTYNSVLNVLASTKQKKDLEEAEELLGFLVDSPDLIPDSYSFNALLKAYGSLNMGLEAERLVQRWRRLYMDGLVHDMPDCYSYSTVINCWARTNVEGSGHKAQAILDWMEANNVTPNTTVYNGVLNAWGRSGDAEAAIRVQKVWARMPHHDKFSFVAYLQAIYRTGSYDQMCEAEEFMKQAVSDGLFLPDVRLCSTILSGYAHSEVEDAVDRTHSILEWMNQIGLKPDTICFNVVLESYKLLADRQGKAEKAMRLFQEDMETKPSTVTYTVMVELCQGHDDYLMELFEDCTQRGMLDERLIGTFRALGPPVVAEQLTGEIPFEWRCNASRGPSGPSKNMIRHQRARNWRGGGMEVDRWGW